MAAGWQVVYTHSETVYPFIFSGGDIDLSTMILGDIINIRVRKQLDNTGVWTQYDQLTFTGAQPVTQPVAHIYATSSLYGVEIAMQQTAGVLRTIPCEFLDARR
jgi:hypothetical protein